MKVTMLSLQDRNNAKQAAQAAMAVREYLRAHPAKPAQLRLGNGAEETHVLVPVTAFAVFATMLDELAAGHTITVAPAEADLTTQQAADLLNVSRPYLIGILEKGEMPYRRVGNRRKVLLADLLAYRRRDEARRQAILDDLTAEAQEMGLYD
jgi:excisionase family DNA binding protein